uniref:Mitochondrial ribosomal protein L46 n=1 Tax=Eptatretus burgeri TaxID=7764 RepID=A0A8C4QEF5_EPTBU
MGYPNMAAPIRSVASVLRKSTRRLSLNPFASRQLATNVEALADLERPAAPWRLFAAACVERLPVVRLAMEAQKLRSGILEDDDDLETLSGLDVEEQYEKKFNSFVTAPRRTEADELGDRSTHQRCLPDKLVLLFREQLAADAPLTWCLPQAEWMPGESLRQTAERALITAAGDNLEAKFLGNAPAGFYKYKFPSNVRTENSIGGKIFFFKAILHGGDVLSSKDGSYVWVTKVKWQDC